MLKQVDLFRKLQASLGVALAAIPLSPNQWTMISVLIAFAAAAMIASENLLPGLLLFAVAAAFDLIDGAVARARGQVSKLGGFIDGVADRFVEAAFLFSFMFYPLPWIFLDSDIWLAAVIFLGTCMPSFVRAYADHKEIIAKQKALALGGICERSERIGIIVLGLAAGIFVSMEFFVYALMLAAFLSAVTVLQRLSAILKG